MKKQNEYIASQVIVCVLGLILLALILNIKLWIQHKTLSQSLVFIVAWAVLIFALLLCNYVAYRKKEQTYLFFDTETTGLPKNYNVPFSDSNNWPRLVQIAWVITDNHGNHIEEKEYIVKPNGFEIPEDVVKIHGITTEKALAKGENLVNVLSWFANKLTHASYVVAHNMSFDESIVGAEFYRVGMYNSLAYKSKICTKEAGTKLCKIPSNKGLGYKWPSLKELHIKLFGNYFDNSHNALADTQATARCFWEMRNLGII